MIPRKIPHFIEIERNDCAYAWGIKYSLNRGIGCAPVTSVENTFLCGMQSSESSFIVTSTGSSTEDGSESYESLILRIGGSFNGRFGFCDVPFGLSFLFAHHPSDNPARAKILDRTPCRNCQQLDRLCNWIANVTAFQRTCFASAYTRSTCGRGSRNKHTHIEIRPGIAGPTYTELCTSKRAAPIVTNTVDHQS